MERNAGRQKEIMIILLLFFFSSINAMEHKHFHNPTADSIALTLHELDQRVTDIAIVSRAAPAWQVRIPRPNNKFKVVVPLFCIILGGIGLVIWRVCF